MSNRLQGMGRPEYAGLVVEKSKPLAWTGAVRCLPERLNDPLMWRKPRRVFVNSMSDLFHPAVPFDFVTKVFDVMAATSWHTYQVLTKRPGRMAFFAEHVWPKRGGRWEPVEGGIKAVWPGTAWPANVWAGTSVESAKYLPRLDVLARVPAAVRFVSCEPLLGPLDKLSYWLPGWCSPGCSTHENPMGTERYDMDWRPVNPVNWVICGGESGPGARPMHPDWVRSIRDQCAAAGVPFFFKQWGGYIPRLDWLQGPGIPVPAWGTLDIDGNWWPETTPWNGRQGASSATREYVMVKVGKKAAGALLDGQTWRQFPEAMQHGD